MLNTDVIFTVARNRCMAEMQEHFNGTAFEKSIQRYTEDLKARCESEKFAHNFQRLCPLQGATAGDYNSKIIDLPGGDFVVASLRFFALNPARPFIMIEFSTFELTGENILSLLAVVKSYYTHLPVHKFHFTSGLNITTPGSLSITRDKIWVKGLIAEDRPARYNNQRVELLPMTISDEQYNIYSTELDTFLLEHEYLRGELNLEDRKYLDQLAFSRFLFEVRIDGHYAGFMAVDEGFEYSCFGVAVIEEFLFTGYRGKGYGKVIQSMLIDNLINLGWAGSYLYGSIAPANVASLKTAAANWRQPFLYSYFIDLPA